MSLGNTQRDIERPDVLDFGDYRFSPRTARITEVFDANSLKQSANNRNSYGLVKIVWLEGSGAPPTGLAVVKPWFSWKRGAGIHFMPCVDDIVTCTGKVEGYPLVTGFLPFRWNQASKKVEAIDTDSVGYIPPLHSGEIYIKSGFGSDLFFAKEGYIKLTATDATATEAIATDIDENTTEPVFKRVLPEQSSAVSEMILGRVPMVGGGYKQVGSSAQVFEVSIPEYLEYSATFPYPYELANRASNLFFPEDIEVVSVDSVVIDNITIKESQYSVTSKSIYTPGSKGNETNHRQPCSVDKNSYMYTFHLPKKTNFTQNSVVSIRFTIKKTLSSYKMNQNADIFLDGRNVVMRSQDSKASLFLSSDGSAELRGINTKIGDTVGGSVNCNSSGVQFNKGVILGAEICEKGTPDAPIYVSISETLPLLKYSKSSGVWQVEGVSYDEYADLTVDEKNSIGKTWSMSRESALTQQKITDIMNAGFPSYSTLKAQ